MSGPIPRTDGGLTLVELLVSLAIGSMLVSLLAPGIQIVREHARATCCQGRLRDLAMATSQHADLRQALPPARHDGFRRSESPGPTPGPTWLWTILPFVEATRSSWPPGATYEQLPEAARKLATPAFLCPTRRDASSSLSETSVGPPRLAPCGCILPGLTVSSGMVSDYAGNHGDLSGGTTSFYRGGFGTGTIVSSRVSEGSLQPIDRVRWKDITDGQSATILIGESHVRRSHLQRQPDTGPAFDGSQFQFIARIGGPGVGIAAGPLDDGAAMGWVGFGSWHPTACHFAFADGRVARLSVDIDSGLLGQMCNRADGEWAAIDP